MNFNRDGINSQKKNFLKMIHKTQTSFMGISREKSF